MSDIEFETDRTVDDMSRKKTPIDNTPFIVRWVMKVGAPNVETANYILFGVAVLIFILAAVIVF